MTRRKKAATQSTAEKPRHRVRWPAEHWGADARVEIDVVLRQDNDPAKIHITTTQDHKTGGHPEPNESIPQGRAGGVEEQPSASPAKEWQMPTKEAVNESMARLREAMQATASPTDGKPAATIQPAEPTPTQAEIQALTKPDDESWFEAIDAVCEKIGIYGAFRWFLGAVGAGAGGATVVWAVNKLSQ
jgi:hypothetical protein